MKKITIFIIIAILSVSSAILASAAEIPRETAPASATEEAIQITENIIGGILDEVHKGLGYQKASARANTKIRKAVENGETSCYGYGVLSAISQNAIRSVRDMYLRPDVYAQYEEQLKVLLADTITAVENGMDFDEARKEAYIKIYQSINPSFNPDEQFLIDTCYRDMPTVDMAMYNRAHKLLNDVRSVYAAK